MAEITFEQRVMSSLDDVEQQASGSMYITSSDLELVDDVQRAGGVGQTVGIRFTGINIPHGVNITKAYIQFQAKEVWTGPTSVLIHGENSANAAAFADVTNNVSSRAETAASVTWTLTPWTTIGEAGLAERTPDITSIVQPIVDMAGWSALNSMAFIITGSGTRTAAAYDLNPAAAPLLHIEYVPAAAPVVGNISIGDVSITEGDTGTKTAAFTVSRTGTAAFTVGYATADGTATAGSDYLAASGTLSFAAGQASQTISVPINGDTVVEPDETLFVNLTNATNGGVITRSQGVGTIVNDDGGPVVGNISIGDSSITGGDPGTKTAAFTVSRTGTAAFTVGYATADGTATAGSDYLAASGTLSFAAGQASQTISVPINGDTVVEPDETLFVNLTNATNGGVITRSQGVGTIVNDDGGPVVGNISIGDSSITGGDPGTKTAAFTVSRTGTAAFTVGYATADGTATAGSDYLAASGTLSFAAGQASQTISVPINGDTVVEPDETLFVNLTNATNGGVITRSQGVGTIVNDDVAPTAITFEQRVMSSLDDVEQQASGSMYITSSDLELVDDVQRAGGVGQTVGIRFTGINIPHGVNITKAYIQFQAKEVWTGPTSVLIHGENSANAAAFADVTNNVSSRAATAASVTWTLTPWTTIGEAGLAERTPDITSIVQPIVDMAGWSALNSMAFIITGSGTRTAAAYALNPAAAPLLHIEYVPAAAPVVGNISIGDVSITEGDTGTKTAAFTVSRTGTAAFTVGYATADGTATAGSDYLAASGTLSFAAGQASQTISVPINGDTVVEPDETLFVNLTNATNGGVITRSQGVGTIVNDDGAPVVGNISIGDVSITEGDTGTKMAAFTVSRTGTAAFTVGYATADGTATAGSDYLAASGTLSFAAGQASQTISVPINGDTVVEPDETLFVNLTNATNGGVITRSQGVGTIVNDDGGPVVGNISIGDSSITGGDPGTKTAAFTVSRTGTAAFTVGYATADGTATAGSDYLAASGTLSFAAGQASQTISVPINGDTVVEPDETLFVNLTNATNGGVITRSQGVGTIVNDDGAPPVGQNHAPTDLALLASQPVKENVAGAVAGTLSVSDPDPGETYTYTLSDARFKVVGNLLELKDNIRLDYEREQQVTMNVTATDHGGLSVTKPVTVSVGDVAEARFAALGDFGASDGSQAVADLIGRMGVDFIVTTGDNSYGTTVPIDDQIGKYYSHYIGNYTGAYGSGSAVNNFFPTLGNHDYDDLGINAYLNYFTLPGNERYYDFRMGPVHFFVVGSESNEPDGNSVNSVQAQWLHAGLASSY